MRFLSIFRPKVLGEKTAFAGDQKKFLRGNNKIKHLLGERALGDKFYHGPARVDLPTEL